ncbi:hypothetical protein VNO78_00837 [Psophocarpus tetragonolobus]|uniref:Uncharacterized protein n=1 Tax=Psophocarpus tetragonolobus TaxID=3891 RepID=A0AAN9XUD2_PSOTE
MFGGNQRASTKKVTKTMKGVGYKVGAGFTREVQEDSTVHTDCDRDVVVTANGKNDVGRLEIGRRELEMQKPGEQRPQNGNEAENGVKHGQRPIGNTQNKVGNKAATYMWEISQRESDSSRSINEERQKAIWLASEKSK